MWREWGGVEWGSGVGEVGQEKGRGKEAQVDSELSTEPDSGLTPTILRPPLSLNQE